MGENCYIHFIFLFRLPLLENLASSDDIYSVLNITKFSHQGLSMLQLQGSDGNNNMDDAESPTQLHYISISSPLTESSPITQCYAPLRDVQAKLNDSQDSRNRFCRPPSTSTTRLVIDNNSPITSAIITSKNFSSVSTISIPTPTPTNSNINGQHTH